jgi:hypothetical protein
LLTVVPFAATTQGDELDRLKTQYDALAQRFDAWQADLAPTTEAQTALAGDFDALARQFAELASPKAREPWFWSGRCRYFAAVLGPGVGKAEHLASAQRDFIAFLDLADVEQDQWSAELLGLEHEGMCQAVLGLALAHVAQSNAASDRQADFYFELLAEPCTPPTVRQQRGSWLVQAGLWSGNRQWLKKCLDELAPRLGATPSAEQISLCALVASFAFRPQATVDRATGIEALDLLLSMQREDRVRQLIWALEIELKEGSDELQVLCALMACQKALQAGQPQQLLSCSRNLEAPLNRLWVQGVTATQLEARYTLAHLAAQRKHYQKAVAEAQRCVDAVADLRKLDQPWQEHQGVVQNAAKVQIAALEQNSRWRPDGDARRSLLALLKLMQSDAELFGAEVSSHAAYTLARLQMETSPPEDVVKWLASIPPEHPDYTAALFDITSIRFRQWRTASDKDRLAALEALTSAGKEYWRRPDRQQHPHLARDLEVMLRLAEAELETPQGELQQAAGYLIQAERIVTRPAAPIEIPARGMAVFHYLRMRLAERQDDQEQVLAEARWLAQHAQGQPVEQYGLTVLCRRYDLAAVAKEEPAVQRQVLADHGRLLALIEQSAQQQQQPLFEMPNAESIAARHSELALRLSEHQQAAATLDKLVEVFPRRVTYLRQAAVAHAGAKSFAQAANYWGALSQLLNEEQHGEHWYEAKLSLIDCLTKSDPAAARQVYDQFQHLYAPSGKLRSAKWQTRWDELGRLLASQRK